MSMKNPMTPAGIEPAAIRFAAKHLNHCATAVPMYACIHKEGRKEGRVEGRKEGRKRERDR